MGAQVAPEAQPLLRLQGVSFCYPGRPAQVLRDIYLAVDRGETLLITGPTGCGKSTLLKTLNGIIPHESSGIMTGGVFLAGEDTRSCPLPQLAQRVGLVFQSPDDQLFCTTILDEVAFGPQNLGLAEPEVKDRVRQALEQVGLSHLAGGSSAHLSGGQKQRLAIAAQLAMRPQLLALDEPISQLDPAGAAEVMAVLRVLADQGMSIVLVEHRIAEVLDLVTRVVVMDEGALVLDCQAPRLGEHVGLLEGLGVKVPDHLRLATWMGKPWRRALRLARGQASAALFPQPVTGEPLLRLENVSYSYPRAPQPALDKISLELFPGEVLALMGPNGSGKSTLLGIMGGLERPSAGAVVGLGKDPWRSASDGIKAALLFQNPDLLLIEPTLASQLAPAGRPARDPLARQEAALMARRLGLEPWLESPPWALSKGQRLRAALGSLLALKPGLLLLDEPTTGQNQEYVHRLLAQIRDETSVRAVVLCSHDLDTVCRFATRAVVLDQGLVVMDGPVDQVMDRLGAWPQFCPRPPLALAISRELGLEPPFLTMDELLACLEAGAPEGYP